MTIAQSYCAITYIISTCIYTVLYSTGLYTLTQYYIVLVQYSVEANIEHTHVTTHTLIVKMVVEQSTSSPATHDSSTVRSKDAGNML